MLPEGWKRGTVNLSSWGPHAQRSGMTREMWVEALRGAKALAFHMELKRTVGNVHSVEIVGDDAWGCLDMPADLDARSAAAVLAGEPDGDLPVKLVAVVVSSGTKDELRQNITRAMTSMGAERG